MAKTKKEDPVKMEADIKKVVRTKADTATITLEIPASYAPMVPVGEVVIEVQKLQKELVFGKPYKDDDSEDDE